ncbi:MAG: PAS domain-containing protein [bacterium]|nr:PAS domain-containing protein [bacterium]
MARLSAGSDLAVLVTDGALAAPGPTILYVNPAFEQMTGFEAAEVLGETPRVLQGPRTSLAARKAMAKALRDGERHTTVVVNYRKSGEPYHCEIDLFPIVSASGELVNVVALEREVDRGPGRRPARAKL